MLIALCVIAALALFLAALYGLHRLALKLDERGYLYYRTKPAGGGRLGGVLMEFDKLTRPSIEQTLDAREDAERMTRPSNDGE